MHDIVNSAQIARIDDVTLGQRGAELDQAAGDRAELRGGEIVHEVSSSCGSASSHDSEGAGLRQSPRTPHHCTLCDTSTPGEIAACTCVDCPNRQKEAA